MKKIIAGKLYDTDTAKAVSNRIDRGYRGVEDAIEPLTYEEAREWAEEHLDADQYQSLFGLIDEEDNTRVPLSLSISAAAIEKARRAAAQQKITLAAYFESLIFKAEQ